MRKFIRMSPKYGIIDSGDDGEKSPNLFRSRRRPWGQTLPQERMITNPVMQDEKKNRILISALFVFKVF